MADAGPGLNGILVIHAHSRPGVLAKIASMFYRRGLNIRTLTVGTTQAPEMAKIVIHVTGDRAELQRLVLSIGNLVDVLSVAMIGEGEETEQSNHEEHEEHEEG